MKRVTFCLLAGGLLAAAVQPARAQCIDQEQRRATVHMAAFTQGDLNQSFKPGKDQMSGAEVKSQPGIGVMGAITIKLYDRLPCDPDAVVLAQGTDPEVNPGDWATVEWDDGCVSVTPGQEYWLNFTNDTQMGLSGDTRNPYANGYLTANRECMKFPNYDYTFATFCDCEESCGDKAKVKAVCKTGGAKVKGKVKKANPNTPVTFTLDGGQERKGSTNNRGKAKVTWKGQNPGQHTVAVCGKQDRC